MQGVERQLASFLSAKGSKRQSLPAMPRHQREVVHALAEQYGMASSSYKQEPLRYVELFKLPASSIPNKSVILLHTRCCSCLVQLHAYFLPRMEVSAA